jgi:lysozyme family protein
MADTGVNMGIGRASTFLQIALNAFNNQGAYYADIVEDGDIGSGTLKALSAYWDKRGIKGKEVLLEALNCQQGAFYLDLTRRRQKDEKYIYGWFSNRVVS